MTYQEIDGSVVGETIKGCGKRDDGRWRSVFLEEGHDKPMAQQQPRLRGLL
jgi:hypothetical protein